MPRLVAADGRMDLGVYGRSLRKPVSLSCGLYFHFFFFFLLNPAITCAAAAVT